MKYISTLILFLTLSLNVLVAQDKMDKGTIVMEISDVQSQDEAMAAQLAMLKGGRTKYIFDKSTSYVETDMMGGMINMKMITDIKSQDGKMYMDMMGNKMLIPSTAAEREELQGENKIEWDVTVDNNDKKTIEGYECHKVTLSSKSSSQPMKFILYVTEAIEADASMVQGVESAEFKGFPLEVTTDMGMMTMTNTVVSLTKDVDKAAFNIDETGYKKMTMKEFAEQMGAMGGGLGF